MIKVIIDTNILVSALIQKNFPYLVLEQILTTNKYQICLSEPLLNEYENVLNRPKFSKFKDFRENADFIIEEIKSSAKIFNPRNKLAIISDEADNRLLELAEISEADYLITGNSNDFTFAEFGNTKILNAKDFYENFLK